MTRPLEDGCGRVVNTLRLSVTDRCNLRCLYCMPAGGAQLAPRQSILSFEEIVIAVQAATELGIDRVRVTGGEPLLRRDLPTLVRMLRTETDVAELTMTTNALLLHKHVDALVEAGLDRLNVSLDSLRPDRFERVTRHAMLEETWRGIHAASRAGLRPIKINTVVLAGFAVPAMTRRRWCVKALSLLPRQPQGHRDRRPGARRTSSSRGARRRSWKRSWPRWTWRAPRRWTTAVMSWRSWRSW